MRSAGLLFSRKVPSLAGYDGIIVTDLMSLADFKAFCGQDCPPVLVYFHENQITYPMGEGEKSDPEFGMIDLKNALAGDRILFNSRTHMDCFFSYVPRFLERIKDFPPGWVMENLVPKTAVLHPGCPFPAGPVKPGSNGSQAPLIVWNHRWSFDKNYRDFFHALDIVLSGGREFRLALMGESYGRIPREFHEAKERYGDRVVQFGYVASKKRYRQWLKEGAIVVSTARQENFGISMVEAMRYGCIPLLPNRLSYPEVLPREYHGDFLYRSQRDLIGKLSNLIDKFPEYRKKAEGLPGRMECYSWDCLIGHYDGALEELALSERCNRPVAECGVC